MEHSFALISTLAACFGSALALGVAAQWFKAPPLVGYLLAGVIISPATPGYVADMGLASQLSEIGIMLLMFGVGLHFSLRELLFVKWIAVPGAVLQMGLATSLGMLICRFCWDWTWGEALVYGLSLSCASTVVLLKGLESRGITGTMDGQIAVGWLVVEDIMTVLLLVLLPPLSIMLGGTGPDAEAAASSGQPIYMVLLLTVGRVAAFIAVMLVVGKRVLPWILWQVEKTGSRELFTLCVLSAAIGIAYSASVVFHVSFALGAFFAGMVMRESKYAHAAAVDSLPLQDAFSVVFFVGVGMMFDPMIIIEKPLHLIVTILIIILGKSLGAFVLVTLMRYPLHTALRVAAALAQIGEFSFILGSLGVSLGLLPKEGMSLLLAAAIFSIALNPVAFALTEPIGRFMVKRWKFAKRASERRMPHSNEAVGGDEAAAKGPQVIIVGGKAPGVAIYRDLEANGVAARIIEEDLQTAKAVSESGMSAVLGKAENADDLRSAGAGRAAMMVVTIKPGPETIRIISAARKVNPGMEVALFAKNAEEAGNIGKETGAAHVLYAERELTREVTRIALSHLAAEEPAEDLKEALIGDAREKPAA